MVQLAGFLFCYAAALLFLAPYLSLWLDEVLTLVGAVKPSTSALLDYIKTFPGGTPLTFLPARWSIQLFGNSVFAARLPSALASVAACPAIYLLAKRLKLQTPMLAVLVFALWPLQLRYALEARPYALALALSVWSTEIFLSLRERPSREWIYVGLTVLAALAQPYALFISAAHLLHGRPSRRAPVLALAFSTLVLTPWYVYYRQDWRLNGVQQLATFDPKSVLVFLREISGSGYFGLTTLIAGLALALRQPQRFWVLCIAVPIVAVFSANVAFHYFFATRQLIFILPGLALLFTLGGNRFLLLAFLGASLYEDIRWFQKPREDWQAASDAIEREVSNGACVIFLGDSDILHTFFHPGLGARACSAPQDRVVVAVSPYVASRGYAPSGLTLQSRRSFDGPVVEVYAK